MRYVSFTFPSIWAAISRGEPVAEYQDLGDVRIWSCHHLNTIDPDDVLLIHDVFDKSYYEKLFPEIKNQWPKQVFNDGYDKICAPLDFNCYSANIENLRSIKFMSDIEFETTNVIHHCANFTINKYQLNRFLCLKLMQWFNINAGYTWSGLTDLERNQKHIEMIREALEEDQGWYDQEFYDHLTQPLSRYATSWISLPADQPSGDRIAGFNPRLIGQLWNAGLNYKILHSATSILTETDFDNFGIIFTEKTSFAVAGLTFPIWLNCPGTPDLWKSYGFDIFEDVINHDYQHEQNFVKRYYQALSDNLDILTDREVAWSARKNHQARLLENRRRLFEGNYLDQAVKKQILGMDQKIQPLAQAWYKKVVRKPCV